MMYFLNFYYDYYFFTISFLTNTLTQIKKEKVLGDGCKEEPMDTTSSSVSVTDEEKKPDIKKEPKEEEEGVRSTGLNSSTPSCQSKKKGNSEMSSLQTFFKISFFKFIYFPCSFFG